MFHHHAPQKASFVLAARKLLKALPHGTAEDLAALQAAMEAKGPAARYSGLTVIEVRVQPMQ